MSILNGFFEGKLRFRESSSFFVFFLEQHEHCFLLSHQFLPPLVFVFVTLVLAQDPPSAPPSRNHSTTLLHHNSSVHHLFASYQAQIDLTRF